MSDEVASAGSGAASGAAMGAMAGGPIGAIGGALIGGGLSYLGQSSANATNMQIARMNFEEAQRNRDFQERMANTTYQRAVKDLQAAGLNPMMAYGNIHTAMPSGAQGVAGQSMQNTLAETGRQVGDAVGKGMTALVQDAQVKNMFEQNRLLGATTGKEQALELQALSQADLNRSASIKNEVDVLQGLAMTDYYKKLQIVPSAQAAHFMAQIPHLSEMTKAQQYENVGRAAESRMYGRSGGDVIPYVKQVLPAVSSAAGGVVAGSFLGGKIKWGRK